MTADPREEAVVPTRRPAPCPPSTRMRLLRAFAVLADHGVTAYPGFEAEPPAARRALRDAILAEYPHALGSYIFWTAGDEPAFADDGSLRGPLVLHHSGADVVRAAHAALSRCGLRAVEGDAPDTLVLLPAGPVTRSAARAHRRLHPP